MRPTFALVLLLACSGGGQDKDCPDDDCVGGGSSTDSDVPTQPDDSANLQPGAWGQVVLDRQALAAGTVTGATHRVTGSLRVGQQAASSHTYSVVGRVTLVRP